MHYAVTFNYYTSSNQQQELTHETFSPFFSTFYGNSLLGM